MREFLKINDASHQDCRAVRLVCERVSTRSAHVAAAALATLVKRIGIPKIAIGADGSIFRRHPHFTVRCLRMMELLLQETGSKFTIELSSDGSGVGAAIVAATQEQD